MPVTLATLPLLVIPSEKTVGEALAMSCSGEDERAYQMVMRKGDPGYSGAPRRTRFPERGT